MSAKYTRDHCKIAVAKILQTIGWHSINSTPMEVLTDLLSSHINQIAKISIDYASEFGQTEANLDHLGLAFQELGVNLEELEEYVTYVNFMPQAHPVPKYPLPKESNLNFLKPGSKEVVTRPIHINEHLPPMYPLLEEQTEQNVENSPVKKEMEDETLENQQFKKPGDMVSPEFKRPKKEEEGSRPTREISSVMMTTSGFLSPACEGKLPESKAPMPPPEPPKPPSPVPQVPELISIKKKIEKKKEKVAKDVLKLVGDEKVSKKIHNVKDVKLKQLKTPLVPGGANLLMGLPPWHHHPQFLPHVHPGDLRMPSPFPPAHKPHIVKTSSFNKTLAAAKAKTEKLNTTITPIPIKSETNQFQLSMHHQVDKLITEPDKKKINILKKISNVKEKHEKPPKPHLNPHLMQQTRDIVNKINLSSDITIEPINPPASVQSNSVKMDYFDSGSPPSTPILPKTPDVLTSSPPLIVKERKKRKEKPEKPKVKKARKQPMPHFLDPDVIDIPIEYPKAPEPLPVRPNLPFQGFQGGGSRSLPNQPFRMPLANFGGPGLIPHPYVGRIFPFPPLVQNLAEQPPFFPHNPKPEPVPKISPKPPEIIKQEPAEIVPLPAPSTPPNTPSIKTEENPPHIPLFPETPKKSKEHKKDKKEKIKKKNKKEKVRDKSEKKKLKEAKKDKDKKEKKKKVPKEEQKIEGIPKILLKVNSPSPSPEASETMKKLNIKPIVKKEASPERKQRETSPGLAKISALVTGPPKQKNPSPVTPPERSLTEAPPPVSTPRPPGRPRTHPLKPKTTPKIKKIQQPYTRQDADGNTVWFCPDCNLQDDGRPMIGCDGCDAWYHWVCVGIQIPPDNNENWYCRKCLAKKNADLSNKKKKRKKKNP